MKSSRYIEWAKTRSQARYNLATSGVAALPLAELGATLEDLELTGGSGYGYEPLLDALATHCNVARASVVAGIGASGANHLVLATLLDPGDEVLVETPVYDPLLELARSLHARVASFERSSASGFALDPEAVRRALTPQTRLIVLSDLHNPSGARACADALREIVALARGVGARVLVDEVYLEVLTVLGLPWSSAFALGPEVVVTSSLTKAYGLSGLRCGWILAEPELAHRLWQMNDLLTNVPAHPAERLSVLALARLERAIRRARALLTANRPLLDAFLASRDDLELVPPGPSTVVFPRWRGGDVEPLCSLLRERYETTVVPGYFFGRPDHFRLGIGGETAALSEGLARLGAALDELRG